MGKKQDNFVPNDHKGIQWYSKLCQICEKEIPL